MTNNKTSVFETVLKGYMMKKGHKRKNWTERWFVLRPNSLSYYVSEDLREKRGDIILDQIYCVEVNSVPPFVVRSSVGVECGFDRPGLDRGWNGSDVNLHVQIQSFSAWTRSWIYLCVLSLLQSMADKEGRKCLFIIKCSEKNFEISASDKKKKQEWIQGVFLCSVDSTPEKVQVRKKWPAAAVPLIGMFPCLLHFSHSNLHPAAEVGAAVSSPWSPAQAQRAAAEAAGGGGGPGGEDEAAAGSQWAQTEAAGGDEEGTIFRDTLTTLLLRQDMQISFRTT